MSILKKLFGSKEEIIVNDVETFWQWFMQNEKRFYKVLKQHDDVQENFVNEIIPRLQNVNEQFYCLAGMYDDNTAELIVTPEGVVKDIVFAEELVAAAPQVDGWKFTALKPAEGNEGADIQMEEYRFNTETLSFIQNSSEDYPDEIAITILHPDFKEENSDVIINGTYIFLDNFLGELNTVTLIDDIEFASTTDENEPIPIAKLPEYLNWRQKEFVEKYDGTRHSTEEDNYVVLEGNDENELTMVAVVDEDLLNWDAKPSHPWILSIEVKYDGANSFGMPGDEDSNLLNEFEDKLIEGLSCEAGYLNLGRETYNSVRTIYFACKEFRIVSKTVASIMQGYSGKFEMDYKIYKDKYWITLEKYRQ